MATSGIIIVSISAVSITVIPMVPRPVSARPPVTMVTVMPVMIVVPVTAWEETHIERAPAPAQTKAPAAPGVVADVKTPGAVAGIVVIRRDPRPVVPACAVEERVVINITAEISRGVTDINDLRCTVIDMDILYVVHR